ncbi:hypothetical protein COOONC_27647 [Cooperia oncophora]
MASPRFDGSPEQAALDVHSKRFFGMRISRLMVLFKLEGISKARVRLWRLRKRGYGEANRRDCCGPYASSRKGLQIRVHIDEQGGKWELGDPANGGRVFRYQQQALPGPPTDAVVHDPRTGTHRAVAAFRSKYQVIFMVFTVAEAFYCFLLS